MIKGFFPLALSKVFRGFAKWFDEHVLMADRRPCVCAIDFGLPCTRNPVFAKAVLK